MIKKESIIPPDFHDYYHDWRMSPGLACNDFVFLTGFTGIRLDGTISADPTEQIRQAFKKVGDVLAHGGISFGNIVEMTSYHVDIQQHIDQFRLIRNELVTEPYPAWTAIEVAGLINQQAIVEIRVIAHRNNIS